jgi:hypothetical protein
MKSSWKMNLSLSLAGMCLTAGLLGAAEVTGSFTLPHQTRWGTAVLPAGDYTLTLERTALNNEFIFVRRGNKTVAIAMARGVSSKGAAEASSIRIVENRVQSVHLAPVGLTYDYAIPKKQERELLARRSGAPGVSISIAAK